MSTDYRQFSHGQALHEVQVHTAAISSPTLHTLMTAIEYHYLANILEHMFANYFQVPKSLQCNVLANLIIQYLIQSKQVR